MSELREQFLRHMALKGYSESTKQVYLESIIGLTRYYNLPPDQMNNDQLCRYLHYGIGQCGWSRSKVNQVFSAMKSKPFNSSSSPKQARLARRADFVQLNFIRNLAASCQQFIFTGNCG